MIERNTIQYNLVLKTVAKLRNHATADEIYQEIAASYSNIGRGTVYRNLNKLVKNHMVLKVETPDGPDRFDHKLINHYHVLCVKCGRIFDVDMDYMDLNNYIKNSHGFEFLGYTLVFKGICPSCNRNRSEKADNQ